MIHQSKKQHTHILQLISSTDPYQTKPPFACYFEVAVVYDDDDDSIVEVMAASYHDRHPVELDCPSDCRDHCHRCLLTRNNSSLEYHEWPMEIFLDMDCCTSHRRRIHSPLRKARQRRVSVVISSMLVPIEGSRSRQRSIDIAHLMIISIQ